MMLFCDSKNIFAARELNLTSTKYLFDYVALTDKSTRQATTTPSQPKHWYKALFSFAFVLSGDQLIYALNEGERHKQRWHIDECTLKVAAVIFRDISFERSMRGLTTCEKRSCAWYIKLSCLLITHWDEVNLCKYFQVAFCSVQEKRKTRKLT